MEVGSGETRSPKIRGVDLALTIDSVKELFLDHERDLLDSSKLEMREGPHPHRASSDQLDLVPGNEERRMLGNDGDGCEVESFGIGGDLDSVVVVAPAAHAR